MGQITKQKFLQIRLILAADLSFLDEIGLKEHLSPTRSNGLLAMLKQMLLYAEAFKLKEEQA